MAREPENGSNGPSGTGDIRSGDRIESSLNRRSYLKLAGTAALATAAAKTAGAATEDDYEVIEVAAGDTHSIRLGDGDRLENVLIDISAQGAGYDIQATGDDWVIRNVGVRGEWDHSPSSSPFRVSVESAGSSARIENVYLGDGVAGSFSANANPTGLYAYWHHAGTLEIRNVNVQEFPDNGMYLSAPGNSNDHPNPGHGGEVHVYDSYAKNNQVAGFRLGTDGSFCENCVAVGGRHRGFWGYYGNTELIDCDLVNNGTDIVLGSGSWDAGSEAQLTVDGTRFDSFAKSNSSNELTGGSAGTPRDRIPEGVPTTPEEAAAGRAGSTGGDTGTVDDGTDTRGIEDVWREDEANHLVFSGGSSSAIREYRLNGVGTAEYGENANTNSDDEYRDTIATDGDSFEIEGYLGGAADDFHVEGGISNVDADDDVTVRVNGVQFDPSELEGVGPQDAELEHTILVDGVGTDGVSRYEFTVSGTAEKSTHEGASIDDEDTIESGSVTGAVGGWRDAFRFGGELEEFTIDGPARVFVDGEQLDPSEYGDAKPHLLTLVGNGSDANYEINVDGTIDPVSDTDADQYATVRSDTTVEGSIDRGVQRFRFSGTLTDVTFLDGSAHTYLDGERIDPDEYGDRELLPHAIVIDGTDTDGETSYAFTVDGEVITSSYRDASIDAADEIDGRSVSGTVDDSLDAYWFDGDIADFRLAGDASIDVEYGIRG